jgi:hypothetical protein
MFIRALFAALVLIACGQEEVHVTLTPATPELAALLLEAEARWEAAGVGADRITIGEGGAPVSLGAGNAPIALPSDRDSYTRIAHSFGNMTGIKWMHLSRLDPDHALHEMGHALGINDIAQEVDHLPESACDVLPRPVMCANERGRFIITAADLDLACNVGSCTDYVPETE